MIETPCKGEFCPKKHSFFEWTYDENMILGVPEQPNNLEVIPSESRAELIWQKPFAYHDSDLYYRYYNHHTVIY